MDSTTPLLMMGNSTPMRISAPRYAPRYAPELHSRFREFCRYIPEKRRRAALRFRRYFFLHVVPKPRNLFIQTPTDFLKFIYGCIL